MVSDEKERIVQVDIADLVLDQRLQARAEVDRVVIDDYSEGWKDQEKFPPIRIIVVDGSKYVVDGFLRVMSASNAGVISVPAVVKPGTWDDAVAFAVGANAKHGARRSSADKRKAVTMAITQWPDRSDRLIAGMVKVSVPLVGSVRSKLGKKSPSKHNGVDAKRKEKAERASRKKAASVVNVSEAGSSIVSLADVAHVTKCPECNCPEFVLDDGGKTCSACLRPVVPGDAATPLDSVPAVAADPVVEAPTVDSETGSGKVKGISGTKAAARKSLGELVRLCDRMKIYEQAREHLNALSQIIG
jgi:hypothetical protein